MIAARTASLAFALTAFLGRIQPVRAQEPPLRTFNARDGLAHTRVNQITRDSRGYVWFATWEGVTRFDGRHFVSYGSADGLPNPLVWAIAEDEHGTLWMGTHGGGLARLGVDSARAADSLELRPLFSTVKVGDDRESNTVFDLAFDRDGALWCATAIGLFRGSPDAQGAWHFEHLFEHGEHVTAHHVHDSLGRMWFVSAVGVARCDGARCTTYNVPFDEALGEIVAAAELGDGHFVVAQQHGLSELDPLALERGEPALQRMSLESDLAMHLEAITRDAHGALWIGTTRGLIRRTAAGDRVYTTAQGLPDEWISCITADSEGGLWFGTHREGAALMLPTHIENFTRRSGLPEPSAVHVLQALDGRILVATEISGFCTIDARGVASVAGSTVAPFANAGRRVIQDRSGAWWLGTDDGLWRCAGPDLDLASARRIALGSDGAPPPNIAYVHEDPRGRIFVSSIDRRLYCRDPARGEQFERCEWVNLEASARDLFSDKHGALWIGTFNDLTRCNGEQCASMHIFGPGTPVDPRVLFEDSRARLWIGTRFQGVCATEDESAVQPTFVRWTPAQGLSSECVYAIAEDARQRMYFGTTKGLDRLDAQGGALAHLTTADGLAGDLVHDLIVARDGAVWVATESGVSRLDALDDEAPRLPPRVYVTRVVAGERELALPALGAVHVGDLELSASAERLIVDFVGVDALGVDEPRFQIKLDGVDADWSAASARTSVEYGHLAPGPFRFLVRALARDGRASEMPASVEFRVLPPFWRQWWFVALAVASAASIGFAVHRARLRRALALERIRTQIATDLHDDIGAGLAQIAILSEVAKRASAGETHDVLGEVAELARGLRASMSDLVWAVDPRRDTLGDLVRRMRQFASDLLGAGGLEVEFRAPPEAAIDALELSPDRRRNLLYLFREAVTNIARHARATHVNIEIRIEARRLCVSIRDDGCGFDTSASYRGNGLDNLRRRAKQLGAELELDSAPGRGTRIEVDLPLRKG